ncbi:MAG: nuclear transport factor 2 family protein [Deltaproteobacteria bacterium]|nr:nuclear transport factor 2 family protein [Deltaproteobacteria bacterium]
MSVEENKKVVFGFVEALLNGDIEAARATLADDATWWIPGSLPVSGTHYGKKAIFDDFMSRVPFQPGSVSIQIRNALGEGEFVAVEWTTRAKTIKGSDYENSYNYLFEIRNGKIQSVREYLDTLYAKEVLFG